MTRIFVYGSLRKDMYNYNLYLKNENSFRQYGFVKGSLFTIKNKMYPALLLEGHGMVKGEIHEVSEETLHLLDALENCNNVNAEDNEYEKISCTIYDESENVIEVLPVFVFNMKNLSNRENISVPIKELDYVKFIQNSNSK